MLETLPNSCGQERIKSVATSGYFSGRFNTKVLSADGCQTHPPVIHMTTIIFAISTLQSINVHNGILRCHTKLKWHTHNTLNSIEKKNHQQKKSSENVLFYIFSTTESSAH